ncbi:MAG: ABC transporter permease [Gemmatimonadota bacterium]
MKGLHWFVARHYLGASGARGLLSLITWIALGGITVGVTALVVVVSVVSGMEEELRSTILDSTPHIYVMERAESLRLQDWPSVRETVMDVDGVVSATPFMISQVAIVRTDSAGVLRDEAASLYGVDTEAGLEGATGMEERIMSGALDLRTPPSGLSPILLGSELANVIGAQKGDTLVVVSFENLTYSLGTPEATLRQFEVTGTFTTGMYDYDIGNVYTTLTAAQDLLGIEAGTASGIGARTADPTTAREVAMRVRQRVGPLYYVQSWELTNQALFDNLTLTKLTMQLMLFLIVVVAAFNIVSTLVMSVTDRTREIGILKAMGMTRSGIVRVFVLQGAWIGVAGTLTGALAGASLAWLIDTYRLIGLPAEIYFFDHLPAAIEWQDIMTVVVGSVAISFIATLYPAMRAARLDPVAAIRSD